MFTMRRGRSAFSRSVEGAGCGAHRDTEGDAYADTVEDGGAERRADRDADCDPESHAENVAGGDGDFTTEAGEEREEGPR